ncbi:DUF1254 domain-containing protein [Bradyrhizobium australiense]|nr:DUF1254 domain-containing protein [Bradyrhizobium australiense]
MGRQRSARFSEGVKANTFQHQRKLVSAKGQFVTTPNNDTLYSQAWLYLEKGPVTITVPDSKGRYYCIPFMDMRSLPVGGYDGEAVRRRECQSIPLERSSIFDLVRPEPTV